MENFKKSSAPSSFGSHTNSAKTKTPKSSQTKMLSTDSVKGKLADDLSARKSAAEPQQVSHGAKTSSSSKQKIVASHQRHSAVVDHTASGSHEVSQSSTEMVALERQDKKPKQELSTKVNSDRQRVSKKQPNSAHGDSRPASRSSVYACYLNINQFQQLS